MKSRIRPLCSALALLAAQAQAATYVVTRFDDPPPVDCTPASCSLREAALKAYDANSPDPPDRIQLANGVYTLQRGELPVPMQGIEVVGVGSGIATGTNVTEIVSDELLFSTINSTLLSLRGVRIGTSNGNVLYVGGNSSLALDDVAVPVDGGNVMVSSHADVVAQNSEFRDNFYCNQYSGTCTIRDSALLNLYVNPSSSTPSTTSVLVQRSLVDGDLDPQSLVRSVALHDAGSVVFEDSTITHGKVIIYGAIPSVFRRLRYIDNLAAMYSPQGTVTIEDSEFRDNTKRAIEAEGDSHWIVRGSSFVNNRVDSSAGGALLIEGNADVRISNSTFSGNTFTVAAAQAGAHGAAIGWRNATSAYLLLRHVTLAQPAFLPNGILGSVLGGVGGGIQFDATNSLFAGTCAMDAGVLTNNLGNLESAGHSCGFATGQNYVDISAGALALGALADNGGATPTRAPGAGSFAIDRGNTSQCLATDQRGYGRPAGVRCDIGALEVGATDTIFVDGFGG